MNYELIACILGLIIFETAQQMFFKLSGNIQERRIFFCALGIAMYLIYLIILFKILKQVPLGFALPIMGLNYVAVALLGRLFFKEAIHLTRWIGIFLILIGFTLVGIGGADFL